jgi:hypothetical protein
MASIRDERSSIDCRRFSWATAIDGEMIGDEEADGKGRCRGDACVAVGAKHRSLV